MWGSYRCVSTATTTATTARCQQGCNPDADVNGGCRYCGRRSCPRSGRCFPGFPGNRFGRRDRCWLCRRCRRFCGLPGSRRSRCRILTDRLCHAYGLLVRCIGNRCNGDRYRHQDAATFPRGALFHGFLLHLSAFPRREKGMSFSAICQGNIRPHNNSRDNGCGRQFQGNRHSASRSQSTPALH